MNKFKMELTWHNCKTCPPEEEWNTCLAYTDGNDIAWCVYNKRFPIKEDELHKFWWADVRRTVRESAEFKEINNESN